jgi:hypothetical protein
MFFIGAEGSQLQLPAMFIVAILQVRDRALRVAERVHPKADPAEPGQQVEANDLLLIVAP